MDAEVRRAVTSRGGGRCEYCQIVQALVPFHAFHVEHIVARQHGGTDDLDNLCLACDRCNAYKGPNLTGIDPETGEVVPLFHPRRDNWHKHFAWCGPEIFGLTAIGRATVRLLGMNDDRRVMLRAELMSSSETRPPRD
jgi:5-methylcytosine-specific restriction endonuclease McrA